jgi:hypothetical protein
MKITEFWWLIPYGINVEHPGGIHRLNSDSNLKNFQDVFGNDFTPLMNPQSDIWSYQTPTEGEAFMPLKELAKIAFPTEDKEGWTIDGWHLKQQTTGSTFAFEDGFFLGSFYNGDPRPIQDTFLLYDYLNSLKIDYRGWLDVGLAKNIHNYLGDPKFTLGKSFSTEEVRYIHI